MNKKLTIETLKKRLDVLLKVVRYYGTQDGVTNRCTTCVNKLPIPIKELQCGHFIKRGNQRLKYVRVNLMPQCRRCNKYLDGAQDKAAYHIIHTYGLSTFDMLVEADKAWQAGRLGPLKRSDIVAYYNYWLGENRRIEGKWNISLIPKSWEPTE